MNHCVVCPVLGRTGEDGRPEPRWPDPGSLVCGPDRDRIHGWLRDIPDLYAHLDATPGANPGGGRVTGTPEAPLGVRVSVLDLMVRGNPDPIHDPHGDQTGTIPVITVLETWMRDWVETRARGEHWPAPTVPILTGWLIDRLDWACQHHPAMDAFAGDLRSTIGALNTVIHGPKTSSEVHRPGVPCRRCDYMELYSTPDGYIECHDCGDLLTPSEYARWVRLVAAGHSQEEAA